MRFTLCICGSSSAVERLAQRLSGYTTAPYRPTPTEAVIIGPSAVLAVQHLKSKLTVPTRLHNCAPLSSDSVAYTVLKPVTDPPVEVENNIQNFLLYTDVIILALDNDEDPRDSGNERLLDYIDTVREELSLKDGRPRFVVVARNVATVDLSSDDRIRADEVKTEENKLRGELRKSDHYPLCLAFDESTPDLPTAHGLAEPKVPFMLDPVVNHYMSRLLDASYATWKAAFVAPPAAVEGTLVPEAPTEDLESGAKVFSNGLLLLLSKKIRGKLLKDVLTPHFGGRNGEDFKKLSSTTQNVVLEAQERYVINTIPKGALFDAGGLATQETVDATDEWKMSPAAYNVFRHCVSTVSDPFPVAVRRVFYASGFASVQEPPITYPDSFNLHLQFLRDESIMGSQEWCSAVMTERQILWGLKTPLTYFACWARRRGKLESLYYPLDATTTGPLTILDGHTRAMKIVIAQLQEKA